MARIIRQEHIGEYALTMFQRTYEEAVTRGPRHKASEYAIYPTANDHREFLFSGDFAYGDDMPYMERKWASILADMRAFCSQQENV